MRLGIYPHLYLITIVITLLLAPLPSHSEIFECGGTWTNKPCDDKQRARTLVEQRGTPEMVPVDMSAKSKKRSIFHDLSMKQVDAKRTYEVDVNISQALDVCVENQGSTVEECRKVASELDDKIATRIVESESLKLQQRANELQAERNKIEATKGGPNVTIIRQVDIVYTPLPSRHRNSQSELTIKGEAGGIQVIRKSETSGSISHHGTSESIITPTTKGTVRKSPGSSNLSADEE